MLQKKPRPKVNGRNKSSMPLNHSQHKEANYGSFDSQENRQDRPRHNNHRGNHQQMFDKYMNLARDSLTAGDRVAAEFNYQHADHFLRLMNERNQDREFKPNHNRPQHRHNNRFNTDQAQSQEKENSEIVQENDSEKALTTGSKSTETIEEPIISA
ncbi:MAG: DUF4167 domain-containing protein [Alphaproteobacteria bacterium]|nr:DUF4167 domain-containing protein [Alphaproteobacteria bacterium]